MGIILNIDTAVETSSVCLAKNEKLLGVKINPSQKDSAAWLHVAIKELMLEQKISLNKLHAVAVSAGPGSYTGLRVGMAAAKGLCYALQKPLIAVNTLQMMAWAAHKEDADLLCPMIDARRMEVFTAVFDKQLNLILPANNIILNESSFQNMLQQHSIIFFGNGSNKLEQLIHHQNAVFKKIEATAESMIQLSVKKYDLHDFTDIAYSEPLYGKDFYSSGK